jgi:hypothetical protein
MCVCVYYVCVCTIAGVYNFTLESNDGAQLYIDNEAIADTRLDTLVCVCVCSCAFA